MTKKIYSDMPDWVFEINETSACVYKVVGKDNIGHTVSAQGSNVDEIINKCKRYAKDIENQLLN